MDTVENQSAFTVNPIVFLKCWHFKQKLIVEKLIFYLASCAVLIWTCSEARTRYFGRNLSSWPSLHNQLSNLISWQYNKILVGLLLVGYCREFHKILNFYEIPNCFLIICFSYTLGQILILRENKSRNFDRKPIEYENVNLWSLICSFNKSNRKR